MLWVYLSIITVAHMLNHVFVQIHLALVPVFMVEFGIDLFTAGLMATIPLVSQALMSLPFGVLADRFQHRFLIAASLLTCGIAAFLVSQAPNIYTIVLCLSMLALSSTLYHPPAYSLTSDLFPIQHRSRALGVHGAGGTLGIALGPISAGVVMSIFGQASWRLAYLMWAVPSILSVFLILRLRTRSGGASARAERVEAPTTSPGMRSILTLSFLALLLMIGISAFGGQAVSTFMTKYLEEERNIPIETASILFGSISLTGIIAAPIGGLFADMIGERRWLTVAYVGLLIAVAGIAFSPSMAILIPSTLAYGFFNYTGMGPRSSLVARFTPKSRRGIAYAMYFLPPSLVGSISPMVSAYVIEAWGFWYLFPFAIVIFVITLTILQLIPIRESH